MSSKANFCSYVLTVRENDASIYAIRYEVERWIGIGREYTGSIQNEKRTIHIMAHPDLCKNLRKGFSQLAILLKIC